MNCEGSTDRRNRTETVGVRFTRSERALVRAVARVDTEGNVSAWARRALLRAARARFRELIAVPRADQATEDQPARETVT